MQMLRRHGCLPFFSKEMSRAGFEELKKWIILNSARYLRLSRELTRIVAFLSEKDITAIPFKGVIWKELLYPQVPFRQSADIDLYIPQSQIKKAFPEFERAGYSPVYQVPVDRIDLLIKGLHSLEFKHNTHDIFLDIHWHLAEGYCSVPYEEKELRYRTRLLELGDEKHITVFEPEIMMFLLVVHGAKNNWSRLIYLVDLACFISHFHKTDWSFFVKKMQATGLSRMLWTGIELLKRFFYMNVPEDLDQSPASLHPLVDSLYQCLVNGNGACRGRWNTFKLNLKLREGWREKIKYITFRIRPKKVDLFRDSAHSFQMSSYIRRAQRILTR